MSTSKSLRSHPSFRRGLAWAGFLGVMLWMFQALLAQPLAIAWSFEVQSYSSENSFGTEEPPDGRKQATGSVRHRSRQLLAIHVPHTAFHTVRHLLPTAPFPQYPSRIANNPAWTFPLRC